MPVKIEALLADKSSCTVQSIRPNMTLSQTARRLLDLKIGALIVTTEGGDLCGIVSERDLIHLVAECDPKAAQNPVSDVMTQKVITCHAEDEIGYVLRLMNTNAIRHVPVMQGGTLINMLSIRELTRAYEMLQIEANTDPLTELSNRRPFLKTMKTEVERARRSRRPLAVAMIDLDHFKRVNDTYGHEAGDTALRKISDQLILEFRSIDLIGRIGGEEFAVVFPETDLEGAFQACERLRGVIEKTPIFIGDQDIYVTASIGIAMLGDDVPDETAILKRADQLLYDAKASGRNCVVFEPLLTLRHG